MIERMKRKIYEPAISKAEGQRLNAEAGQFEKATSYCPLYLAWRIVDEARDYFRTSWVPSPGTGTRKKHLIRPADTFSPSDAEKACLMSEELADKLARRAEDVFAKSTLSSAKWRRGNGRGGASSKPLSPALSPFGGARVKRTFWQRKYQSARGREYILMSMRHWLAGVLARERPALFRDLPESFKVGLEIPARAPHPGPLPRAERVNHRPRFVHGCEMLAA